MSYLASYFPFIAVPIVMWLKNDCSPWVFMTILSFSIFFSCKWMTLYQARPDFRSPLCYVYLLFWPGMDAASFLMPRSVLNRPSYKEGISSFLKMISGLFLVYFSLEYLSGQSLLVKGWVGLVGLGLFFHFGSFSLMSYVWRSFGIAAQPIINQPTHSITLQEFWAKRWNVAFHQLASRYCYFPLKQKYGKAASFYVTFFMSGLMHELVISYPANAGYGLPTLYFLIHAMAIQLQSSRTGKSWGLSQGMVGRLFTVSLVVIPLPLLFHAPFIKNVIVPLLQSLK